MQIGGATKQSRHFAIVCPIIPARQYTRARGEATGHPGAYSIRDEVSRLLEGRLVQGEGSWEEEEQII